MTLCSDACIPCCDYCKYVIHEQMFVNNKWENGEPIGCKLHPGREALCNDFYCCLVDESRDPTVVVTEFESVMRRKTADINGEQIMVKYVEMSGFDVFADNLEEFVNKQGCTFGEHAGQLQKLLNSIIYCCMHGVVTGSQQKQMLEKYSELLEEAITVKE